ncbi:GDSL esterase/lipase At5g03610 [Ricinus communis]|uniref:Carboxylic ester hydrolase, putative n=1 Tax=Ricinus communis TaxID=3988 RepID=B9SRU3_RICCO|nr:GDSL esterase/lipase At5g03610 [Ricinus communis]EEF33624.1 carboxylic ester hydrolase, putative [Ricinus communis]|eukprot:XP_002528712.1 GDSL esterase/lipase At5g03610 [Ricinus communis]
MGTLQFLLFSIFSISLLFLIAGVHGGHQQHHHHHRHRHLFSFKPSKLFVFGDSYADTGNVQKSLASSWKEPYGITFPGKPAGRFSDGRILTDYLARFIGVKSPMPYKWRKYATNHLKYGMNFAYGGTGVFDTFVPEPNMTVQIDLFQNMINDKVYTTRDLHSSAALVSLAGNDYATYLATNGSAQGFPDFIRKVVNQITVNLKRIHELGVKKVAVTALQPLGCLPRSTFASSFQQCNGTENELVSLHNLMLQQAVAKLNNETKDSTFVILDIYSAFMTVFKNKGDHPGSSTFQNPLKPCCVGTSTQYSCGDLHENGTKMYTVCDDPEATFFWDTVHPTQEGWRSVYLALQANLQQL